MPDWADERAKAFFGDRGGCPNDPWTNKRDCEHCLALLLRQVAGFMRAEWPAGEKKE